MKVVKKSTLALVVLSIALILSWGSFMILYGSLKSRVASYEKEIDYLLEERAKLLDSYKRMYREWTTPPEEIPETEEEREQLAINIVDANRRECEESGRCVPLHNITWHVRHVDGFWYKVQYDGIDEEGRTWHSALIYVNIASSEMFADRIAMVEIGS